MREFMDFEVGEYGLSGYVDITTWGIAIYVDGRGCGLMIGPVVVEVSW